MKIVADTNTFLAVAMNEPERPQIIRLTVGHDLVAPEVLPFELGNALTDMMKKGVLRPSQVTVAWDSVQVIPVELRRIDVRSALGIAAKFRTYAYDAYFLECALSLRLPLLTLDGDMRRVARDLSIPVLELGQ
jgi:predicted nucleic acid-binding protein